MSSRFRPSAPTPTLITVGDALVHSSSEVRNLGAVFDEHMTMRPHVKKICRTATAAIHKIGRIRNQLDKQTTVKLIHAFVTSRLDSGNALLSNMPDQDIQHLQRIQNISARIIERTRRTSHITPILHNLHWLPMDKRTHFKILLMTYKALHGLAPSYISHLLVQYTPRRTLRSQNQHLLHIPRARTQTYGHRSFSFIAPTLWNNLPFTSGRHQHYLLLEPYLRPTCFLISFVFLFMLN